MRKVGKNLVNLLKKTAIISGVVLPLALASCHKENYAPEAKLEVSPVYGKAPLEVRIKVDGTDLNGKDDIIEYIAAINSEIIKSDEPIEITRTFENPGTVEVYGMVKDTKNESDVTATRSIKVYENSFLGQSVSLFNETEIKYDATLSNVDNAELKINRDGLLFLTEQINDVNETGVDYSKTFNNAVDGITKGNYEFVLKSESLEKRNSVVVPNYTPTSTIGGITINLNEEADSTITLPTPSDKNPEDNPVAIASATSLDGKTELTLNGYELKIKALPGYVGDYQVEVEFGSAEGGLEKAILQGHITENPDPVNGFDAAMNPYSQPNMQTLMGRKLLDYYGSGDVNDNGTIDSNDADAILAGTETGNDRADVNGDGTVNSNDAILLMNYVNGTIPRLPSQWNHLNRAERIDWFTKMLEIDKTDERQYISGVYECGNFSKEHLINFFGIENLENYLYYDKYAEDGDNNARFNIPVYMVADKVTPGGGPGQTEPGGHYIIGVLVGPESGERYAEDPTRFSDWYFVEPQADLPVQPGDWSMNANNYVHIEWFGYSPSMDLFATTKIVNFELTNGEPTEISPARSLLLTNPNAPTKK